MVKPAVVYRFTDGGFFLELIRTNFFSHLNGGLGGLCSLVSRTARHGWSSGNYSDLECAVSFSGLASIKSSPKKCERLCWEFSMGGGVLERAFLPSKGEALSIMFLHDQENTRCFYGMGIQFSRSILPHTLP